jgi:hypothetical protein
MAVQQKRERSTLPQASLRRSMKRAKKGWLPCGTNAQLGMMPSEYREGGAGGCANRTRHMRAPLGQRSANAVRQPDASFSTSTSRPRQQRRIPGGILATYAEMTGHIAPFHLTRSAARTSAANLLSVSIPCHHVVRMDGSRAGNLWGLERMKSSFNREFS